jgi:hypothetical protein
MLQDRGSTLPVSLTIGQQAPANFMIAKLLDVLEKEAISMKIHFPVCKLSCFFQHNVGEIMVL